MTATACPARGARLWRWAFGLAVLGQLVLLYWPRPVSDGGLPHLDKVAHLLAFAAVAWTGRQAGLALRPLVVALVGHGVLSEVLQATALPDRSGDPVDVVADWAGVLLGCLLPRTRRGGMMAG